MLTIIASLSCLPSQAPPHACTANSFAFSSFSRLIGRLRTTSPTWIRQRNLNLTAFYFSLKSKVGLIAAKAAALRISMNTDSCLVASRTASRDQNVQGRWQEGRYRVFCCKPHYSKGMSQSSLSLPCGSIMVCRTYTRSRF